MTGFERNIVDGPPCQENAVCMEVHGLALQSPDRSDISHVVMECAANTIMRSIVDVSQLTLFMEQEVLSQGIKGPLVGMWATQLCAAHIEGQGILHKGAVLERLGSWFLPTDAVCTNERFTMAHEEPHKVPSWLASAQKTNGRGKVKTFNSSLMGITLPRTPRELDAQTIYEAVPLASAGGKTIFGFLHHRLDGSLRSIERVVYPPQEGKSRRAKIGGVLKLA